MMSSAEVLSWLCQEIGQAGFGTTGADLSVVSGSGKIQKGK